MRQVEALVWKAPSCLVIDATATSKEVGGTNNWWSCWLNISISSASHFTLFGFSFLIASQENHVLAFIAVCFVFYSTLTGAQHCTWTQTMKLTTHVANMDAQCYEKPNSRNPERAESGSQSEQKTNPCLMTLYEIGVLKFKMTRICLSAERKQHQQHFCMTANNQFDTQTFVPFNFRQTWRQLTEIKGIKCRYSRLSMLLPHLFFLPRTLRRNRDLAVRPRSLASNSVGDRVVVTSKKTRPGFCGNLAETLKRKLLNEKKKRTAISPQRWQEFLWVLQTSQAARLKC